MTTIYSPTPLGRARLHFYCTSYHYFVNFRAVSSVDPAPALNLVKPLPQPSSKTQRRKKYLNTRLNTTWSDLIAAARKIASS